MNAISRNGMFTILFLVLGLVSIADLRAEAGEQRGACADIARACAGVGFSAGNGLHKECIEPILAGQTTSPRGVALPNVSAEIVAACRTAGTVSRSAAMVAAPSTPRLNPILPPQTGGPINNSDGLLASEPVALFTGPNLGMHDMPDQQTPILPGPGGGYRLFVTGVLQGSPGGVVSVFSTPDLTQASAYTTSGVILQPPQHKKPPSPCTTTAGDGCADYIGMEAVFETASSSNLVGFYIADQTTFANLNCSVHGAFYGQLGVATSTGNGQWTRLGPTLRAIPPPSSCPAKGGPLGFNQPTVIKIRDEYYAYFWLPKTTGIAVARASVGTNGLPGPWSAWTKGGWQTVPTPSSDGVQTVGSAADIVVQAPDYVTMPWVSYNNYLQTYLMTMITHKGFYYSKLVKGTHGQNYLDAQNWTPPEEFVDVPGEKNWGQCSPTWENMSFVTPGLADNHTTGKSGYMVLSVVPGWACKKMGTRSFDLASYSFGVSTPPAPPALGQGQPEPPRPAPRPHPCSTRPGCLQ